MAGEADLYQAIDDLLVAAVADLPSSGDAGDPSTWPEGEAARLAEVRIEQEVLAAHREPTHGTRAASEPPRCAACGESRPCTEAKALRDRYGLSPGEYRGDR